MRDRVAMRGERSDLQRAVQLFAIVFLIAGIVGFIPGITTDYDELTAFDHEGAKVLGLFGVNILENIAHLLYGVAGLALSRTWDGSRLYFIGGGLIYLVLWLYGLIIDKDSDANFVPLDTADNWLHFLLGIGMIGLGVLLSRERGARRAAV